MTVPLGLCPNLWARATVTYPPFSFPNPCVLLLIHCNFSQMSILLILKIFFFFFFPLFPLPHQTHFITLIS